MHSTSPPGAENGVISVLLTLVKSYHSHEVFNFGLLHPNLPLLSDLLDGLEAGSLVRLEDATHQKSGNLIRHGEGYLCSNIPSQHQTNLI